MNFDSDKFGRNVTSKIPTPVLAFRRSKSFRVRGEKANLSSSVPVSSAIDEDGDYDTSNPWSKNFTPLDYTKRRVGGSNTSCFDDYLKSLDSITSNFSTASTNSTCEHAHFAKNGTTFSGKSHKYIVHCSSGWNGEDEYLTPTQRASKNIKRLKSLLQLAKEKLKEKDDEICKLNKEVVELILFKASVENTNTPDKSPLEVKEVCVNDLNPGEGTSQKMLNFTNEMSCELSPIKQITEENQNFGKISAAASQDCLIDKTSITPDFLLSSMGDSGNFDDLLSSASVYSKDSISFINTPELRHLKEEQAAVQNDISSAGTEEEKIKIVKIYEKKLLEKELEYEAELNKVINEQEQKNMTIIHEFEKKLKEEELKFETRWNELLKATEEEKMLIVNRFEEKLEEEREKYRECLKSFKSNDTKVTDMILEMTYSKKVEEEKTIYEASLMDIKQKFENEKTLIEEKFDTAMRDERNKFEESLKNIKEIGDSQVEELTQKVSDLEAEYFELLPKYEEVVSKSEELEKENEALKATLKEQEESHKKIYLEIYKKGQEAAKFEIDDQEAESSEGATTKVSVPELFAQLKITEVELDNLKAMYKRLAEAQAKSAKKEKSGNDPEATLQFLKSAVYYFLTDRENHLGHLKAIESILAFSSTEKSNIEKLYLNK